MKTKPKRPMPPDLINRFQKTDPGDAPKVSARHREIAASLAPRKGKRKPPLGSGQRFKALEGQLAKRPGVTDPGALAAFIGRKKYGAARMAQMAAKGR